MKLFIDTSNSKFIVATFHNNKVDHFMIKDSDNNLAKMANKWLNDFLKKHKINLKDINEYYTTIGPGSFTGVKVGLNIIKTLDMVNSARKYGYINSLDLLSVKGKKYVIISSGKKREIIKKYGLINKTTIKEKGSLGDVQKTDIVNGFDYFTKQTLEDKFLSKKFKIVKDINKINLIYLKTKIIK